MNLILPLIMSSRVKWFNLEVKTKLYYAHDPMCSYCYAFKNTWNNFKTQLPKSIEIILMLGGLAPDNDEPMAKAMQNNLIHTWQSIESRFGIKFNFDFWDKNTPRRSTYPACRAVLIAKKYHLENQMIEAIQNSYYLQAQNPSNIETLANCAKTIGIKKDKFMTQIQSTSINQELMATLKSTHKLGLNSFPSLVLECRSNRTNIPINYVDPKPILDTIRLIINF